VCGCRRIYAALVLAELMRSDEEPRQVAAAFKLPQGQVEAMQDKAGAVVILRQKYILISHVYIFFVQILFMQNTLALSKFK
jgi:hypothetical protein